MVERRETLVLRVGKSPFDVGGRALTVNVGSPEVGEVPLAWHLGSELLVESETISRSEEAEIARDPDVLLTAPVMPVHLINPAADSPNQGEGSNWGINAVGGGSTSFDGTGVTVAVLDSGIDEKHEAFRGVNLVQRDFTETGLGDDNGHGTHCAGTIFGRDVEGTRIGIARGVTHALIGKVLDANGSGTTLGVMNGLAWALSHQAQVVSISIGFDFTGHAARLVEGGWPVQLATSATLELYLANARLFDTFFAHTVASAAFQKTPVLVAASGNDSKRTVDARYEIGASLPSAANGVLSVGALAQSASGLTIADFSNSRPSVSAPGVGILSAKAGGGLVSMNGTSMACPHVAGVAALWWQAGLEGDPHCTAETIKSRILSQASTEGFAPDTEPSDRGLGIVRGPEV